jgi:hypothetical protein
MAPKEAGRDWSTALVKRIGSTIKAARRGKSAAWLSARCEELGYPLSVSVIAKLDSGHRGDALSVPELLVLAAALEIPPALLLFPKFPAHQLPGDKPVKLLPDREASSYEAVKWLSGERTLPARRVDRERGIHGAPPNAGTQLIAAVRERDRLSYEHLEANMRAAGDERYRQLVGDIEAKLAMVNAQIADLRDQSGLDEVDDEVDKDDSKDTGG